LCCRKVFEIEGPSNHIWDGKESEVSAVQLHRRGVNDFCKVDYNEVTVHTDTLLRQAAKSRVFEH
jgi:hypothetical protein